MEYFLLFNIIIMRIVHVFNTKVLLLLVLRHGNDGGWGKGGGGEGWGCILDLSQ